MYKLSMVQLTIMFTHLQQTAKIIEFIAYTCHIKWFTFRKIMTRFPINKEKFSKFISNSHSNMLTFQPFDR